MMRAPSFSASSVVRSADPLSSTMISSQQRRLSMARAMLRSSFRVMMVAVIFIAPWSEPAGTDRCVGEAKQEDRQRKPAEFRTGGPHIRRVVDGGVAPAQEEQHRGPEPPHPPEQTQRDQDGNENFRDQLVPFTGER